MLDTSTPLRELGLNQTGIVPMGDRVMLRLRERRSETIVAPESSWSSPYACPWQVIAVGPGVEQVKVGHGALVEAGRESVFTKKVGGKVWKLCIAREKHIMARQEGDVVDAEASAREDEFGGTLTSGHANGNRYIGR